MTASKMPVTNPVKKGMFGVSMIDDAELVRRFKAGDEDAFSTIVRRHQPRLLQAATVMLKNEQDAIDLTQDVFVKAYSSLLSFREDAALYTWLYRILYNKCISFIRRKKIVTFLSFDSDDEMYSLPSHQPIADELYERKEIMRAVNEALESLPFRQRTIFTMKQIDDLKFSEIAKVTGITEGACKASYFHAVKKLQTKLKRFGEDYGM